MIKKIFCIGLLSFAATASSQYYTDEQIKSCIAKLPAEKQKSVTQRPLYLIKQNYFKHLEDVLTKDELEQLKQCLGQYHVTATPEKISTNVKKAIIAAEIKKNLPEPRYSSEEQIGSCINNLPETIRKKIKGKVKLSLIQRGDFSEVEQKLTKEELEDLKDCLIRSGIKFPIEKPILYSQEQINGCIEQLPEALRKKISNIKLLPIQRGDFSELEQKLTKEELQQLKKCLTWYTLKFPVEKPILYSQENIKYCRTLLPEEIRKKISNIKLLPIQRGDFSELEQKLTKEELQQFKECLDYHNLSAYQRSLLWLQQTIRQNISRFQNLYQKWTK